MNRHLLIIKGLCILSCWTSCSAFAAQTAPDNSPVPYLSWNDLKALYPPKRHIGDWNFPKVSNLPHKSDLIGRCDQDLRLSVEATPDPFHLHHPLPPGKLELLSITKDPDSRVIYFCFTYESELIVDLFVIYYYDPAQDKFILKSSQ